MELSPYNPIVSSQARDGTVATSRLLEVGSGGQAHCSTVAHGEVPL